MGQCGICLLYQKVLPQVLRRFVAQLLRIGPLLTVHAAGFVHEQKEVHHFP